MTENNSYLFCGLTVFILTLAVVCFSKSIFLPCFSPQPSLLPLISIRHKKREKNPKHLHVVKLKESSGFA